jgi:hypothetical protein
MERTMRTKRFRPDGLDLASDGFARSSQGAWFLLLGTALLLAGAGFAAFSLQGLSAVRELEAEHQSGINAEQTAARARALEMNSRMEAALAEARQIQALRGPGWLELLTWIEAAGKASGGRVVLLSIAPVGPEVRTQTARGTGIALTESDMFIYLEGFLHATPEVSAELLSHQPEDNEDGDARRFVFLLRWTSTEEKTP